MQSNDYLSYDQMPINSDDIELSIASMNNKNIKNVLINTEYGYKKKSIDFLAKYEWIEGVTIIGDDYDITSLNKLRRLKHLIINYNFVGELDFTNFPNLKTCEIKWQKNQIVNIGLCSKLEYLGIFYFPFSNLEIIKGLGKVQELKFFFGKLQTLHFIEYFTNLKKCYLQNIYVLQDLENIDKLSTTLTDLLISNCKKIQSYAPIGILKKLKMLYLENCSPSKDSDFLIDLNQLERGYLGIEFLDSNLERIRNKGVKYKKYKSYE